MGPFRAAAAVLFLLDVAASRGAWLSFWERAALWALLACILGGAAALAELWSRLADGRSALSVAPPVVALSLAVSSTHTAWAGFGRWALPLALAGFLGIALISRRAARKWRRPALVTGVGLLVANVLLPARPYAAAHSLLLVGGASLFVLGWRGEAGRPRQSAALVTAATLASLLLLSTGANLRFAALSRAPAGGAILEQLFALRMPRAAEPASTVAEVAAPAGILPASHLVVITLDAVRADVLGSELEAFARRSIRFERAYAQAPHTVFSLTSLLTGEPPDRLARTPRPTTLAERLREQAWHTEAFYPEWLFSDGRTELQPFAESHLGFSLVDGRTAGAEELTDAVLARVEKIHREGEPQTFLWVHYFDAHEPYQAHDGVDPGAPAQALYRSEVAYLDRAVGRLLRGLERWRRPTIVVVTADHGEEFGEHGGVYHGSSVYEEQVRVPLLIRVPGLSPATLGDPIDLVDVTPTLARLLDLPSRPALGIDRSPALLGVSGEAGSDAHSQVNTRRMLVRGGWKLIHDIRGGVDELYDLSADPGERRNLADMRAAVVASLHPALDGWFNLVPPGDLVAALRDAGADPATRAAAARELGRMRRPDESLRRALEDPSVEVRAEAALALAQLDDPAGAQVLLPLLHVSKWRERAAFALAQLGQPPARPVLVALLDAPQTETVRLAIHHLSSLGGEEAVGAICNLSGQPRLRSEAYRALGQLAGRLRSRAALDCLINRSQSEEYDDARVRLAEALGESRDRHALPALQRLALTQPPTPRATQALLKLGVPGLTFQPGLRVEPSTQLRLAVRNPGDGRMIVNARVAGTLTRRVSVRVNGAAVGDLDLDDRFRDHGVTVPSRLLRRGSNLVELLCAEELLELHHIVLLPIEAAG